MSELIAEARVLVTPDTTGFRALLTSQLTTATQGVTVPVNVTPVSAGGASAQQIAGAQARAAAGASKQIQAASVSAAAAQERLARAADIVAVAERRAAASTSQAAAASIRYGASIRATTTTFAAYEAALQTTDFLLIKQTRDAYGAAKANEALALSNLNVARTQAAQTAALAQGTARQAAGLRGLASGAGSAALSMVGLRGATLAATGPFLAGAAGALSLAKAVGIATSFNSEIAVLGATTGATGEELEKAAAAAREFGRDITLPGVTAGDAAKTITEFSKAGLSLNDSIDATRGGLQLAQAAQLSYADAVTLSANALNAFGLSGSQAVVVADTLANAANLAQGGIEDTALALRQAAGAAAVVGVSFKDTTALLTLLARNGLTGSDAGTALRTAFLRLVNPSKEAKEILEGLNVELRDLNGNVRPEVFADFATAQKDLSRAQQQANAAIVFGQDAFRAFGFLGQEGRRGLDEVRSGLEQTGTAARIAQARMTGLAGAQENLSNQLSSLGETVGQVLIPPLTLLVDGLASGVQAANEMIQPVTQLAGAFRDLGESLPERPPGVDSFLGLVGDAASVRNLIDSAVGPLDELAGLFGDKSEETADAIKNGGVEVRDGIEAAGREAARGAVTFQQRIIDGINAAFDAVQAAAAARAQEFRRAQLGAVARGQGQAAGLAEGFDRLIAGGGTPQEQIAQLRRQAQVQARIIENAGPNAAGVLLEARRAAQSKLASINTQITSIEEQIAADAKAAQDEATRIARQAADERTRNFLLRQDIAREQAQQRITLAEDTPALTDDIRRQQELRALIQRQIAALRVAAIDEKEKQAAIRALQAAVFATTQTLKGLRAAQKQQQDENRQAAQDQITENLALRTQIAEARGDRDAVLVALDNQIADAKKNVARARAAKKGVLEAILALEQLQEKKRELLKKAEETTKSFGTFDFLQSTQGFAANLLGNIIPGFATAGLVGNVQPPIQDPGKGFATEVPGGDIARLGDRGVRPVQVDTTNALLRQILAAINGRQTQPPEIVQNRRTGMAEMDTM